MTCSQHRCRSRAVAEMPPRMQAESDSFSPAYREESDKSFLREDDLEKCVGGVMDVNIGEFNAIAKEIGPMDVCWAMQDANGEIIIK